MVLVPLLPSSADSVLTELRFAAATYGPTKGPPPPIGAAPAGWTESVETSDMARSRFRRPLPVSAGSPAASAVRARRDTTTPFDSSGSFAASRAAAPATDAAAAEVPEMLTTSSPGWAVAGSNEAVVRMSTPGAAMKAAGPRLAEVATASEASVEVTPMTPRSPAGKVAVETPSLPVAATRTEPEAQA